MNIVAHNLTAMNASRQFGITNRQQAKVTEKLSSGLKINRAADDAAGLSISEKMRRQIRGLNQSCENIQEGIGYVQVADGALNEVHDMLQRINELAVKAANGTNSDDDRAYIDQEVQALKTEMERIFDTTKYNERKIWSPNGALVQIGTEMKPAVTSKTTTYSYMDITNENYGKIAYNGYKVVADDNGMKLTWKGYDNQDYSTEYIDWNTLKEQDYTFNMGDLIADPNLIGTNGQPLIDKTISFSVQETTTIEDMKECLNGRTLGSGASVSVEARFEDADGNKVEQDVEVVGYYMNYGAAYASKAGSATGKDFDGADDDFIEPDADLPNLESYPATGTLDEAKVNENGWVFDFNMPGVGKVLGTTSSITYYGNDTDEDAEGTWWSWNHYTDSTTGEEVYYQGVIPHRTENSLKGVMDALTGGEDTDTPGLLVENELGVAKNGGYIDIDFKLETAPSDDGYNYGSNVGATNVGGFTLRVYVTAADDEQSVLDKIQNSLNDDTILDFQSQDASWDEASIGYLTAKNKNIEVPIYGGACEFQVHGGVEAGEKIRITYDALSLMQLKIDESNVLTEEAALNTITEIESALQEVSKQRSLFGAYQNRLEHAYNNNRNVEENTTASESQIRDTDMASTMVKYSNNNILLQAGQAMMAQANQSNQGVLSLLR